MTTRRKGSFQVKRVYDAPSPEDGFRVLVDRLWPRGVKKATARVDLWLKDVAPSAELRAWFGHDPERWTEFKKRYTAELRAATDAVGTLRAHVREGPVTLLFGAKDLEHNNAVALRDFLTRSAPTARR